MERRLQEEQQLDELCGITVLYRLKGDEGRFFLGG